MSRIVFIKGATQAAPSTGNVALYAKLDGNIYALSDLGVETQLGVSQAVNISTGNGLTGGPITSTGTISIADNPTIPGNVAMTVPIGTTGQETGTTNGMIRYNSTTNKFRVYENGAWVNLIGGGGTVTSVATGGGLTGGPITSTGTVALNITGQTTGSPISSDEFIYWNGAAFRKTTFAVLNPGNQTITLSGDITGSGTTAITGTLASVGTAGTYTKVTTDAKGRVTAGSNPNSIAGYGILDAQPLDSQLTALSSNSLQTTGFVSAQGGNSFATRTLNGTTNQINISVGDGVGADPTISLANNPILPGTSGVVLPSGTTVQETGTTNGTIRYNTTLNKFRAYENGAWVNLIGGGGTVSSVTVAAGSSKLSSSGSPITASGTITLDVVEANLTHNNIGGTLGTTKGGTGLTSFTANNLFYASSTSAVGQIAPTGTNTFLQWTGSAYQWSAAGSGSVTSVGLTAASSKVTITGTSPITTSGAFTVDVAEANLSLNNIGGTLGATKGGTSFATYATGDTLYASAANTLSKLTIGTTGQVLTVAGGVPTWATPATGTVTSVTVAAGSSKLSSTGSPVTTSGTITLDVVESNLTLNNIGGTLGVAKGGTGLTTITANALLVGNGTSAVALTPAASGTNTFLQWTGSAFQWAAAGGSGTVTSVGLTAASNKITITGTSPITTSGAFTVDVNQANLSLGSIGGSLALGSQVTGTLAATNGGTGTATYATGDILYASATNTLSKLTAGTNGQVLTLASGIPSWATPVAGSTVKDEGTTQGVAGAVTTFDFTGPGITATVSGSTATINVPSGGLTQYTFTVNMDGSGNIAASGSFSNIPSGWSINRDAANQFTVTHNLGVGALPNAPLVGYGLNSSVNGSAQYVQKIPTGNPTAAYSVAYSSVAQTFTVFGVSSTNTNTSASNPLIYKIVF